MTTDRLDPLAAPAPEMPAAHRNCGVLQRVLAGLASLVDIDEALTREQWLGQAKSPSERAPLERAWSEHEARQLAIQPFF